MKIKTFLYFFFFFSFSIFPQVYYKFNQNNPTIYTFEIKGTVGLIYPGNTEKFNVISKGNLKIEVIDFRENIYELKIIPYKTYIKIGDEVLEDIIKSETEISSIISSYNVKIEKSGKILQMDEIRKGILSLNQIFYLLPYFPEKLKSGTKWEQKIPAFNFPGIQMCELKFTYTYNKKDSEHFIQIYSNHPIKETKRQGDTIISFTGKNVSKGEFNLSSEYEINYFQGVFSIDLLSKFEVPPSPDLKNKKSETYNIKLLLNLEISLFKNN